MNAAMERYVQNAQMDTCCKEQLVLVVIQIVRRVKTLLIIAHHVKVIHIWDPIINATIVMRIV